MSYSGKTRILLDTTYLLPIVGVDVEGVEKVMVILRRLRDRGAVELYYTELSIFEIVGKLSRTGFDRERVELGLVSIKEWFAEAKPTLKAWLKALELKRKGFRDLIDLLLYTTSLTNNIMFLTRDKELVEFLESIGENTGNIMLEEEFIQIRSST